MKLKYSSFDVGHFFKSNFSFPLPETLEIFLMSSLNNSLTRLTAKLGQEQLLTNNCDNLSCRINPSTFAFNSSGSV